MPPKALVTGATGFIGSHLVETLFAQEWEVTCLVRPTSRVKFLSKLPVRFVASQPEELQSLEEAVKGQDYIFHLAGRIRSAKREVYERANHLLTRNLVQACLSKNPTLKRFVYISSISAAGPSLPGRYLDENDPCTPTSEYGRSKLRSEQAVQESWDSIPATIIRPPNVYGPRQQETELLIKIISKRIVPLLKEKGEKTSLIYVKDLVEGIIQAALSSKTKNQVYYLTDGKGYSWRKIILIMKRYVLKESFFFPLPETIIYFLAWLIDVLKKAKVIKSYFGRKAWRAMTQTRWLFSSSKAETDFGFRPKFSLEEGIKETVKAYQQQRPKAS
ncbi:MAG: NAD-dependent epimerase/dehydratase family protein [Candidatus Aminicenantes bacterium]|nr:NAD-dependent epimerase/dehydratase family protein [Candidatus Aminicenantes bacterium]